jgi:hypothetical protein
MSDQEELTSPAVLQDDDHEDIQDDFELYGPLLAFRDFLQRLSMSKESVAKAAKFALQHHRLYQEIFTMIIRRLESVRPSAVTRVLSRFIVYGCV